MDQLRTLMEESDRSKELSQAYFQGKRIGRQQERRWAKACRRHQEEEFTTKK